MKKIYFILFALLIAFISCDKLPYEKPEKLIKENHIHAELGEIVIGRKKGRSDDSEITVFKSVGNAAQDLITARAILGRITDVDQRKG